MKYLDEFTIPILYDIYFKIDINNDIYTGCNKINLKMIKPSNQIQFNGKDLNILHMQLNRTNLNNNLIQIISIEHNANDDIYTIKFNTILDIGEYDLIIKFNGKQTDNDGLVKFYHKHTNRTFIYTRCEPIAARKIYPCWDETKYKVKYKLSVEINDLTYNLLANTDPTSIKNLLDNNVLYTFEETIPMSSYVQSFIIAKYYYIESYSKHGIRLRVYIPTDITDKTCGDFALECGIKMLDFMIDYYDISFPFNKIDFIPINDPVAQGMENFGLIFYDIDYLLNSRSCTRLSDRIDTAIVIAHELAHQWFGNILTINEWNSLWLKESFANFFQYFIIDNIFPEWNIKSLNIDKIISTLHYDSYSHKSINIQSINKNLIDNIYSKLTYDKGGLLLNMILEYLGKEQFKINIRNYLSKYKFTVVNTDFFIESITYNLPSNDQDNLRAFIIQFLNTNGYPIIKSNQLINFNAIHFINSGLNNENKLDIIKSNINWQILIKTSESCQIVNNLTNIKYLINKISSK